MSRKRKPIPSPDTVVAEGAFVSPKGAVYRVLRTTQKDPYDPPQPAAAKAKAGKGGPRKRKRRPKGK